MFKLRYWSSLLTVAAIGLILRLWQLSEQSYWIDESYSIALAQSIWRQGWPITQAGGFITRSILYHYLLASFIATPRLLAALFGVLSIVVVAGVAKQLFSPRIAVFTSVLMASSYWEIAWSRQARMYTALQCCVWLTVYCYLRWYKQRTKWWGIATVVSVFICVGVHEFGILVLVVLGLHLASERLKSSIMYGLFMISVVVGAVVCMKVLGQTAPVNYWFQYWYYLITTLPVTGLLVLLALRKRPTHWLAASCVVVIAIFSFAVSLLEYRYIFFMLPAVFIAAAVTLEYLWKRWKIIFVVAIGLAVWHSEYVILPQTNYYLESDSVSSPVSYKSITPQPDFSAAYQYIQSHIQTGEVVITPYPTIQALYAPQLPEQCLYIDLTGQAPYPPTATERYTGCPYLTLHTLQQQLKTGHGYIILDQFAQGRVQVDLLNFLQKHSRSVYQDNKQIWSRLTIYKF